MLRVGATSALKVAMLIATMLISSANVAAQPLIEITDSHGKYRFEQPPQRFVALNWALTEQLLELEELPLGVAGLQQFQVLSTKYEVDESVMDLGLRLSPDLDAIRKLKPEVIFIGYSQRSLLRPLSNIATVVYFKNFGRRYNNAEKSEERFRELAKLFNKSEFANKKIRQRNVQLDSLRAQIDDLGLSNKLPSLLLVAPGKQRKSQYVVFGANSLAVAAAERVGLSVIKPDKTDAFGVAQLSFDNLIELKNSAKDPVCLVVFNKYALGGDGHGLEALNKLSPNECQFNLKYQQSFGGVMSIQWLAEELVQNIKRQSSSK